MKIINFIKKITTWERMRHAFYGLIMSSFVLLIIGLVELFYGLKILSFANILEILKIIIWPLTVIFISLFFQKILAYLFFSLEEFNFFGNKGELKKPITLIREKADELIQREKIVEQMKEISLDPKDTEVLNRFMTEYQEMKEGYEEMRHDYLIKKLVRQHKEKQ
ncbi:MAG: hypothetical protein AAB842_03265 [Patescibacteria group bacterium]